MSSARKNIIFLFISLLFILTSGKNSFAQRQVHLFPDRNFCVSGDTLWFNTVIFPGDDTKTGNVVHVQLDDLKNQHITKVSVACKNNKGHGFLPVPDSLSSGIYVLKSFILAENITITNQRLIAVYNRFDRNLGSLEIPLIKNPVHFEDAPGVSIKTNKSLYKSGETVILDIHIPEETGSGLSCSFISAAIADPLTEDFSSFYIPGNIDEQTLPGISVTENEGILISGKVSSLNNSPAPGAIVLLSIPDTIPFFDYCISDTDGLFYFYLKNARGTGNFVIQALSGSGENCKVELSENYIGTTGDFETQGKILSYEEKTFAADIIDASYYERLFAGYRHPAPEKFSMPPGFPYPFYGKPTKTIFPEEFIDLPDFTEISRELLHGVQYREKKNKTTIRLIDYGSEVLFKGEPLKLFDGIPVFDPHFFSSLGTMDIKKVDVVFYKRFFGSLAFNGILAFYSNDKPIDWQGALPGAGIFRYQCLQPESRQLIVNEVNTDNNNPDFRKVFFHEAYDHITPERQLSFLTSDVSGKVAIRLIAVTRDNKILYAEKIVEVE